MRWLIIAAILALAACSSGGSVPAPQPAPITFPTSPLWHMTPGTWVQYQAYLGTGTFDPATGYITIDQSSLKIGDPMRVTYFAAMMPGTANTPAIWRCVETYGVTQTALCPINLALVQQSNGTFIGEAANGTSPAIAPPEPELPLYPVAGQALTVTSTVQGGPDLVTSFHTLAVGATIDGFTGATETTLVERPGAAGEMAYVFVFDGELAEEWWGAVAADNSVQLVLEKRTSVGANP